MLSTVRKPVLRAHTGCPGIEPGPSQRDVSDSCAIRRYPRCSGSQKLAMQFAKTSVATLTDLPLACLLLKAHFTTSQRGAVLLQLQPWRLQMETSTAGDAVVDAPAILVA